MVHFWKMLVRPAKIFTAPELQRRIVVLNSLMFTYTFFVIVMWVASAFLSFKSDENRHEIQSILGICSTIFLMTCFFGRTRYYMASGLVFTLTIYIGCSLSPLQTGDVNMLINVLPFMIIPALVGAFLLPLRFALSNLLIGVVLTLGLSYHLKLFHLATQESYIVVFNLVVYAILFLGTILRVWDEEQMFEDRLLLVKNSKMQTLGQVAGNIAHEMNTPLGAIVLRASQVARALANDNEAERNARPISMVKDIEKIASDIAKTVDSLRRFSRDESELEHRPTNITSIVESTLRICKQKIENNGTRLEVATIDPELKVLGSEIQISQVILNLLTNAQQAISSLPDKWIQIDVKEQGKTIQICVTDSGKGIPNDVAAKIFDPFFSTKPASEGTGLGLSISQNIIEKSRGRLYLDSTCENTRFVIELPRG